MRRLDPTRTLAAGLLAALLTTACASGPPAQPTIVSLDGRPLEVAPTPAPVEEWMQAEVDAALALWRFDPSEFSAIWVGRRLAYRGLFEDAIDWYVGALETYPDSYRIRRHLGHRLLTVRQPAAARDVLEEAQRLAADVPNRLEPDGAPGPTGEPRSTTHGNIDYHLALARYLLGDFAGASEAWRACLDEWSRNDDSRVAALHWLVMCAIERDRIDEGRLLAATPIDPDDVIENDDYFALVRMYRGELTPDELLAKDDVSAAMRFGVARWLIATGEEERGSRLMGELTTAPAWTSFGVMAAEAHLARKWGTAPGEPAAGVPDQTDE